MLNKCLYCFLFFFCVNVGGLSAQTFTFECFCGYLTAADSNCDVCNTSTQTRMFRGLLIRKNGTAFKWIEQPYTILQTFNALTFKELIFPNPEQIRIELSGTAFDSIAQFRDSVLCPCSGGAGILTLVAGPGISIYGDTIASIPQQVDTFDLVSGSADTIRLSLTRDSVPFHFVILPPDSDNQYIDTLRLTGTTLEISLYGDNLPLSTVDLSSLVADGSETIVTGTNGIIVTGIGTAGDPYVVGMPAGTNTQTLRHNGTAWVANSNLTNDGSYVGINAAPTSAARLFVKQGSASDGISVQQSGGSPALNLYHATHATVEASGGWNLNLRSNSVIDINSGGGGGNINQVLFAPLSGVTATYGGGSLFYVGGVYAPSSSGGDFASLKIATEINQSGSAAQDVFAIDINQNPISLLGQNYGIRFVDFGSRTFLYAPFSANTKSHLRGTLGLGAGTTTPTAKLDIVGEGATSSTWGMKVQNSASNSALMVRDDGRVGILTASPARALHVEGEVRIADLTTDTPTRVVGADADGDIAELGLSGLSIVSGVLTVTADGDGSSTNEGILGVAAGGSNDALLTSNTSGANGVTYAGGTGITISESPSSNGGTITITNAGDLSATNELQTLNNTSDATSHTVTLSNSGGSVKLSEGANVTLTTSGTGLDGVVTIASTAAADGNGIYGDGTPGSGDDFIPVGGSNVSIPDADSPLDIIVDASAGDVFYALRVITDYCNDDAFTKYFVGKSPSDSLEIYNFDCGAFIKETGGILQIETDQTLNLVADSIYSPSLPAKTTLKHIVGMTSQDYFSRIQGTATDQVLKWNNTSAQWELGAVGSGTVGGSGTANRVAYWTNTTTIAADDDFFFDGTNVGIGNTSPSSLLDITRNALGTTQTTTSGIALVNTTAAAAGAQQISPALRWRGHGWKTNATAASQPVEFRAYVTPVQGASAPTGYLGFGSAINGTWANDNFNLSSGGEIGVGTTTFTGKVNVAGVTGVAPFTANFYGATSGTAQTVGQFSNTNTAGSSLLSLNEESNANTLRAGIRRFGSTHATRPQELNITTFQASSPVTIGTNDAVRLTVAANAMVHAHSNLAAGFTSTTGIHSTLQSAGSLATAFLETVGAPTFDATKRTVIYNASTNITWTIPTAGACACPGREYILHHAGNAGTITLSQSVSKGNGGNFNTLTAGQWAYIIYGTSSINGYKITSL